MTITLDERPLDDRKTVSAPGQGVVPLGVPLRGRRRTMPPDVTIDEASGDDLPALVRIHALSLPGDFLVRWGHPFLTRVFFPTLLASPRVRVYAARDAGRVVGLIVTRRGMGGVLGEMIGAHPLWFVISSAAALVRRPWLAWHALGILAQLRSRRSASDEARVAELFLLAVDPSARRRGVGRALIEHSAEALRRAGTRVYRVLLHADNEPAQRVYERSAFIETRIHRFGRVVWSERERILRGG